jgi:hypothetical protein
MSIHKDRSQNRVQVTSLLVILAVVSFGFPQSGAVFMCNRLSESMGASVLEASAAGQRATDRPIILIEAGSMLREECSPCKCDQHNP